ncbi:MAG: putative membrane-bound dehydrogenase-like protein, partial [Pirellulaceae bacterium]
RSVRSCLRFVVAISLCLGILNRAHAIDPNQKPIRALLITGGCCHDYTNQKEIITQGISARARVTWTVIQQGGSTTDTKISIYENRDWAKDFDIVVHNECFAGVTDPLWTERVLKPHKDGLPGIVIHCAMHSYRDKTDEWFKFCGVTSHRHGAHYSYKVENINKKHPIMDGFGDTWDTPQGELYLISKLWDKTTPLAQSTSRDTKKNEVCVWTNEYGKGRVFGTTIGHHNETMMTPQYLNMLTRGFLWSLDKLDEDHFSANDSVPQLKQTLPAGQPTPAVKPNEKGLVPENIALKKNGSASATQNGRPVVDAFDGRYDSRWCAPDNGQDYWLQVDLGKPEEITGCRLVWEFPKLYRYRLEGSVDGDKWQMLADYTKTESTEQVQDHKFTVKDIQYVRVTGTEMSSGAWMSIYEFEVFGTKMVKASDRPKPLRQVQAAGALSSVAVPAGFSATLFAAPPNVNYPTCIASSPTGEVFVGVDQNGSLGKDKTKVQQIVRCIDEDNDGVADKFNVFADKVGSVRGMHYDDGKMWVLHPPLLRLFHDDDKDGVADRNEVLIEGLGTPALAQRGADHCTNGFRMGIDGWIYIAIGDFGFTNAKGKDGTELQLYGGGIVRVRPDGSEMEIFARGTRNIYDVAVDPQLNVFTRDNTNDGGGWDVRLSHIVPTGHYGYPIYFKNFTKYMVQPLADYGGGSPTGSLFLAEPGLPAPYNRALYTCDWGRSIIYRHPLKANGAGFTAEQEEFVRVSRPTDMDVDANARIYIASWDGGSFSYNSPNVGYVVRVTADDAKETAFPNMNAASAKDLLGYLQRPSLVYRQSAQREILRRDSSTELIAGLEKIASSNADLDVRVTAVFTLKQFSGAGSHAFLESLSADATIREHALRALTDRISEVKSVAAEPLLKALNDESPRVRMQAAIGLGRLGQPKHAAAIVPLTADADPLVAHAAVNALVRLEAVEACLAAIERQPTPVAQGALLALSQLHLPNAADGLCELAMQTPGKNLGQLRPDILTALCRLYHNEGEWTGDWWGTRPDTTGPYYKPTTWSHSTRIEQVIRHAAATGNAEIATLLRQELPRHRLNLANLKFNAGQGVVPPEVLVGLPQLGESELQQVATLAMATDTAGALRLKAIEALRLHGAAINDTVSALVALSRSNNRSGEAMLSRLSFVYDPANQSNVEYFVKQTQSDDEEVRKLAFGVLLAQQTSSLTEADAKELGAAAIESGWKSAHTTATLLAAIAELGASEYAAKVSVSRDHADANVKKAADEAHQSIQRLLAPNVARIGELAFEAIQQQVADAKGDPQLGAQLFVRQQCIGCHTVSASQTPIG